MVATRALGLGGCELEATEKPAEEAREVVDALTDGDGTWKDAGAGIKDYGEALAEKRPQSGASLQEALHDLEVELSELVQLPSEERPKRLAELREDLERIRADVKRASKDLGTEVQATLRSVDESLSELERDLKDTGA